MIAEAQLTEFLKAARERGEDAAKAAATWCTTEPGQARLLLDAMQAGEDLHDPGVERDVHLPSYPNLSGEWADGPTPLSLARDIVGEEVLEHEDPELADWIAEAYDEGVDKVFLPACRARLEAVVA